LILSLLLSHQYKVHWHKIEFCLRFRHSIRKTQLPRANKRHLHSCLIAFGDLYPRWRPQITNRSSLGAPNSRRPSHPIHSSPLSSSSSKHLCPICRGQCRHICQWAQCLPCKLHRRILTLAPLGSAHNTSMATRK
jgi:hypothetical protein